MKPGADFLTKDELENAERFTITVDEARQAIDDGLDVLKDYDDFLDSLDEALGAVHAGTDETRLIIIRIVKE